MLQYWRVYAMLLVLLGFGVTKFYGIFSNAGYAPIQPIPFSHAMHAGVLKLECLYCHSNAEKGAHATIPPLSTCMGCHSVVKVNNSPYIKVLEEHYAANKPIEWVRIHRLPDHSAFSHQWHVAAGVACQTCHGPVQEMIEIRQNSKLEMRECITCHRQDTYVANIDSPATFQEGFADSLSKETVTSLKSDPEWRSAAAATAKKTPVTEAVTDARTAMNLLFERDIYYHGRGYQLRNKNASTECSTCHH